VGGQSDSARKKKNPEAAAAAAAAAGRKEGSKEATPHGVDADECLSETNKHRPSSTNIAANMADPKVRACRPRSVGCRGHDNGDIFRGRRRVLLSLSTPKS